MTAAATSVNDVIPALACIADSVVVGNVTVPGRPEHVRAARTFVARALGDLHPRLADAVLLTSELVTNALVHTGSGLPGGTISVLVADAASGVRIEVTDAGSDLTVPIVRSEPQEDAGRGLSLVQALADRWGYLRTGAGMTVWFWLARR